MKPIKAWWFGPDRLPHNDGRPVVAGETLTVNGPVVLCEHGLHGSTRILDALHYSKCCQLWRVEIGGDVLRGDDKLAGTERTALWCLDADSTLRRFAFLTALEILPANADQCIREYLELADRATDDQRAAAYRASYRAAYWAASTAAYTAASTAAYRAAYWAASTAAYTAAYRAAYRAAEQVRQNRRLTAMVMAEHRRRDDA